MWQSSSSYIRNRQRLIITFYEEINSRLNSGMQPFCSEHFIFPFSAWEPRIYNACKEDPTGYRYQQFNCNPCLRWHETSCFALKE
jgi:hypothetical protein